MDPHYFIDNFELEQSEDALDLQESVLVIFQPVVGRFILQAIKLYTITNCIQRLHLIIAQRLFAFYESDKINLQYKLISKDITCLRHNRETL